ncbi:MAG: class I SAM-dependent methyltransferase [Motilibacteraceae bacterium]
MSDAAADPVPGPSGRARSFGSVAGDYDRLRPATPQAALDWLLPVHARRVLDLGAGTGGTTRALLARGLDVVAVEPDERMREVLADRAPAAEVLAGAAEDIPLPDADVDAVIASSAWHWFDPRRAPAQVARVLRPGGRLGVLWNGRDGGTGWMAALEQAVRTDGMTAAPSARRYREVDLPDGLPFGPGERHEVRWTQQMSPADVVALMGTYSGVLALPPEERAARLAAAAGLLAEHPDAAGRELLEVPFVARCWRADRLG